MKTKLVVAAVLAVALVIPTASAQLASNGIKSCGDMELFIANPDMRDVGSDGKYHVAGDFYMQFQVQGDGASEVETFTFSVGLPVENPEEICDSPYWPGGFELESYKADFDKADGFFILMTTTSQQTPQNTDLEVSVHAYDADDNELARFWTIAVVESCSGDLGEGQPNAGTEQCPDDQVIANDRIKPWPVVLPGDGSKEWVNGLFIDFAEELSALTVFLNGEDITAQLVEVIDDARPQWDRDIYWDYGPMGAFYKTTPPCTYEEQSGGQWQNCGPGDGPAYEWTERKMTPDDVVRIEATDLAGNSVVKEIHMAQAATGGTLEGGVAILEMTFDNTVATGAPGDTLEFTMTMENTGSGEGHPFSEWQEGKDYPEGWPEPVWDPGHEPVPPKGSSSQILLVTIPEDAEDGDFQLKPRMDYDQAGRANSVHSVITVTVEAPEVDPNAELDGAEVQDAPAVSMVFVLVALAFLGVVRSRR